MAPPNPGQGNLVGVFFCDRSEAKPRLNLPYMDDKLCSKCDQVKPVSAFYTDKSLRGGYTSWCKECQSKKRRESSQTVEITEKKCSRCGQIKPVDRFYVNRCSRTGYSCECKECHQLRLPQSSVVSVAEKRCYTCQLVKPASYFNHAGNTRDGLQHRCRECCRAHYQEIHDKAMVQQRWRQYGVSQADYDRMLAEQGGVCKICGGISKGESFTALAVDHDHKTGLVRGLLCRACNAALGQMEDDPALLRAAAAYLESFVIPQTTQLDSAIGTVKLRKSGDIDADS